MLKRSEGWERWGIAAPPHSLLSRGVYRGVVELVPLGQLVEVAPAVVEVVPADEVVPFWVFVVVPLVAGV
ncbi:MAG TPA: hypothetical protein VFU50_08520 [Terriglobales bacterium]|nr:hypothetical protein [Terriglobales bacterium]